MAEAVPEPTTMPNSRRLQIGFGVSFVILLGASIFLFTKIPKQDVLLAVPSTLLVLALMVPLLFWQTVSERKRSVRIATWSSCAIWVVGIILSLAIKPGNVYVCIPDALLLSGFYPLLYLWRFSWPWLIFGFLNVAIGILLQVIGFIPDSYFPAALALPKHHLAEFHPPMAWELMGLYAIVFGAVRLVKNICRMVAKRKSSELAA